MLWIDHPTRRYVETQMPQSIGTTASTSTCARASFNLGPFRKIAVTREDIKLCECVSVHIKLETPFPAVRRKMSLPVVPAFFCSCAGACSCCYLTLSFQSWFRKILMSIILVPGLIYSCSWQPQNMSRPAACFPGLPLSKICPQACF